MTTLFHKSRLSTRRFATCVAIGTLLMSSALHAKPNVEVDYRFYTVSPHNYADLKHELDSKSPIRQGDRVAHGHTRINLKWQPVMQPSANGCTVTRVDANLGLRYTLPQLQLASPNEDLRAKFAESYEILHEHEIGHGKLAIEAAQEIDRQLVGMFTSASCEDLEKQAISAASVIYKKYKEKELEYDRLTDHGRNQNALAMSEL